ncbi:hypothetical protein MNV49_004017 [Pseudohyphozyma bogoriensis]|nr:hypothetical protein MNV49_004017 [Pseudohyphozyma bogoriensis]
MSAVNWNQMAFVMPFTELVPYVDSFLWGWQGRAWQAEFRGSGYAGTPNAEVTKRDLTRDDVRHGITASFIFIVERPGEEYNGNYLVEFYSEYPASSKDSAGSSKHRNSGGHRRDPYPKMKHAPRRSSSLRNELEVGKRNPRDARPVVLKL